LTKFPNQLLTNPPNNQLNSQPNTVVSSIPLPLAELKGDYLEKIKEFLSDQAFKACPNNDQSVNQSADQLL
jgi:hypothetical protein